MIEYEIKESFGELSRNGKWTKEFNLISYNKAEPKYDIRSFSEDKNGKKMSKGVTLNLDEIRKLKEILNNMEF